MSANICRICENQNSNKPIKLKGVFYGTKGEFDYFICGECGCLQIDKIPEDMGKYYSNDTYYSFNMDDRSLKNKLLFAQMNNQIAKKNLLGKLVEFLYPVDYSYYKEIPKDRWLLDIGCGQGEMLNWLSKLGFKKLEGLEPFLEKKIEYPNGVIINKSEVSDFEPEHKYRMITFVHSLEHIYDVKEVVGKVTSWLDDDGEIAIVIPFFSKYYWEKYGTYLHTLDPPRHFYLHTYDSLVRLMSDYGMELTYFDTRINPSIPWMAKNNMKGHSEKNGGANFVLDAWISLTSLPLRKKLGKKKDGAIAVARFRRKSNI